MRTLSINETQVISGGTCWNLLPIFHCHDHHEPERTWADILLLPMSVSVIFGIAMIALINNSRPV